VLECFLERNALNSDATNSDALRNREIAVSERPTDLKDPRVVLALLEADQVVAAKSRTEFGRQRLSLAKRVMLWGLRVYVVVMLVIVVVSVFQAVRGSH
jgi:hypothetical protein